MGKGYHRIRPSLATTYNSGKKVEENVEYGL